jgi:hypothetical protein
MRPLEEYSPFRSNGNCKNRIISFLFLDAKACWPIVINSVENESLKDT